MRRATPHGALALGLAAIACGSKDYGLYGASGLHEGTVTCNGSYLNGQTCQAVWSRCSNGRFYELDCDGLGCSCSVDGRPDNEPRFPADPRF